jgi:hypothetical protein
MGSPWKSAKAPGTTVPSGLHLGSWEVGDTKKAGLREKFHRDHGHRGDHLRRRVCFMTFRLETRLALKPWNPEIWGCSQMQSRQSTGHPRNPWVYDSFPHWNTQFLGVATIFGGIGHVARLQTRHKHPHELKAFLPAWVSLLCWRRTLVVNGWMDAFSKEYLQETMAPWSLPQATSVSYEFCRPWIRSGMTEDETTGCWTMVGPWNSAIQRAELSPIPSPKL